MVQGSHGFESPLGIVVVAGEHLKSLKGCTEEGSERVLQPRSTKTKEGNYGTREGLRTNRVIE